MSIEGSTGYAQNAFRAEIHGASPLVKKFENLETKFVEVMNLGESDKRDEMIDQLFNTFSRGYKSVAHMENIAVDRSKSSKQHDAAVDDLDLLGKVVYEAIREDNSFAELIGSGNASGIDDKLPEDFKGIGKVVLTNIFEEGPVLEELYELDSVRLMIKRLPSGEVKNAKLAGSVDKAINEIMSLKNLTPSQEHDRGMALSYLGYELSSLQEPFSLNSDVNIDAVNKSGYTKKQRGEYDGKSYGSPEGMDRVGPNFIPIESLKEAGSIEFQEGSVKDWITTTLVRMSENPLFFVNWWQQSVADQLISIMSDRLGYSIYDKEYAELRDHTYATQSVLGMQTVDRNADANSDNYGQFTPPKNMGAVLHWDNGGKHYETLKSDRLVNSTLKKIFDTAFDKKNGWKIVKAFSDGDNYDTQNEYLKSLYKIRDLSNMTPEEKMKMSKGRVAMAMFEVDWMPEWIRWANENKRSIVYSESGNHGNEMSWLIGGFDQTQDWAKYAYSGTLKSKYNNQEFEIGYDHPRVLRPWDVAAGAKGSYRDRPDLIWAMERYLSPVIAKRLSTRDGRWIRASGGDLQKYSVLDRYSKYGKLMFEIMGGPQAAEFDNLTTMEKIMPLMANFLGPEVISNKLEFGTYLSDLFALKTEAMFFPGYKSNAQITLSAIGGLDLLSGEAEKKKALEGAIGPSGSFAHGWVAEVKRLYGIDMLEERNGRAVYPKFIDAYVKVFMDTPDLVEARQTYNKAVRILKQNKVAGIFTGGFSILKNLTGMR